MPSVTLIGLTFTLVGSGLTVTLQVAVFPLYSFIETFVVPVAFAVILALFPLVFDTFATDLFEFSQLRFMAFAYDPLLVVSDISMLSPLPRIIDV